MFVRDATGIWSEQAKLTASDGAASDLFGNSVSVSGDTALISAPYDDDQGDRSGSVYVFERDATGSWSEQEKLTASDGAAGDAFGFFVSVSGDTALIGAPDNQGSGSAYVFVRDATGTWSEQAKLAASDGAAGDIFGQSFSVLGNTALIGAPQDDDLGSVSGAVYVFVRDATGTWSEQAKLTASDGAAGDLFGNPVLVSGDTALIGARVDDDRGFHSGSVYVFVRDATGSWSEQAKLTASDGAANDVFGNSVSVSGDTALIGVARDDDRGDNSGSAYVFVRDATGNWSEQAKLTASDGAAGDVFGYSVSLLDGTALIGAAGNDDRGESSGSVYVFALDDPDGDGDGVLDVSDNCPAVPNPDQTDYDQDGVGDVCDLDDDNDGVDDGWDNCPFTPNPDQTDTDGDGQGDACDGDDDGDGIDDGLDNCPFAPNPLQTDTDGDDDGDACDTDDDDDGVEDGADNCPITANTDQEDLDGDNIGDACDADLDGDGLNNEDDNCPVNGNPAQDDTDGDGDGDGCDSDDDDDGVEDGGDNCPLIVNPDQADLDGDNIGNACDSELDGDGIPNDFDNCPFTPNVDQFDFDSDGEGDACDSDIDGDGVSNAADLCAGTPLGDLVEPSTGCSIAQLSPCEGPRGTTQTWRNHGKYVSSIVKSAKTFVEAGLITEAEKAAIISDAADSSCGFK